MTYGKLFASLYTGSMIGAGPLPFALMPYIISKGMPDKNLGGYVELNPMLLAAIFGCTADEVSEAIEFLCQPDPKSRTPDEEGRRLVRLGPYDFRVVNYAKYQAIRNEEDRREQNRDAQERHRAKKAAKAAAKAWKKAQGNPSLAELNDAKDAKEGTGQYAEPPPEETEST